MGIEIMGKDRGWDGGGGFGVVVHYSGCVELGSPRGSSGMG